MAGSLLDAAKHLRQRDLTGRWPVFHQRGITKRRQGLPGGVSSCSGAIRFDALDCRVVWALRLPVFLMATPKSAQTKGKRSGKWSVACPPTWPLDDLTVVREVDGALGVELLLALYNTRLVAQTPAELRGALFTAHAPRYDAEEAPESVRTAIRVFGRLVANAPSVTDRELAQACRIVAEWAEGNSYRVTAIGFAEVAAHLLPEDAEMANLAGRACRRAADRARAELWYERGWGLARRAGDVQQYVDGHLGFGGLLRDSGEYGRAFKIIKTAGLAARREGMLESAAEALHDAWYLAYLREDLSRAAVLALRASRIYPVHAKRRPYYTADLALLLCRRGLYPEAVDLLHLAMEYLHAPVERLHLYGLLAYAAAGAQDRDAFLRSLREVQAAAERHPEVGGAALAYAAAGAHLTEDWGLAENLILQAIEQTRGDAPATALAERVAQDIAARRPGVRRPPDDDPFVPALRGVVPEAASRLRRWRGPTWRPPKKRQCPDPNITPPPAS
jgi:tetratricopeptide (TPR) repeat protein